MTSSNVALITGGAGFIGGYTVQEFVEQGWHVLALVHQRISPELEALETAGSVTLLRGDAADCTSLEEAVLGEVTRRELHVDVVVHCAGRASDVGRRHEFRRMNFEALQHMAALTQRLEADRFVFISTTDVYGLHDFHGEREDELPLEQQPANAYPEFKIAAEKWLRQTLPPERHAIIRPAAVWGPGDPTLTPRAVDFLRSSPWIIHFGPWRGRNRWPLAHVRNVATAIYLAATLPGAAGQAINVLDSEVTTMDEFYHLVAAIFLPQRRFRTLLLPRWVGIFFGSFVSAISDALNLAHPFTDPSLYAVYSISSNLDFSNQRLLALFAEGGRQLTTREEGVEELRATIRE